MFRNQIKEPLSPLGGSGGGNSHRVEGWQPWLEGWFFVDLN